MRDVLVTVGIFLVPFSVLIWGMFIVEYTPQYAACMAIVAGAVMLVFSSDFTFDLKRTGARASRRPSSRRPVRSR